MQDYQLERLNTRSFEQLIQAIGLEIIGPQLMIFGDGPDGGREAIFDGPIRYPATKSWSGYGIVQAKFRQLPDSEAKKNADWAIKQLKSEFAKLKPRPREKKQVPLGERVCPEYYIFATNLVLSPVAKKGGKDRVRAILNGFKKSHGLKDYAIWDGDQIRRFLDAIPGVRTTYTAWLLPGDVLSEMMKVLELDKTDFLSTIRRYLESELLDDQYARLGQGGYTDAKSIPLCAVFVDLPIDPPRPAELLREDKFSRSQPSNPDVEQTEGEKVEQGPPRTFLNLFFEESRQVLKPSRRYRQTPREGSAKDQLGRIVLVGGPGQGKTTVGQFACQLLRAALLRAAGGPFSPEVSQALERIGEMSHGLPTVCARRYPLRVDLKDLAARLVATDDNRVKGLFEYLVKRIGDRTNSTVRPADFRRWLGAYPWVLVLDGLDEVPASSNRQQVMQVIRDFVSVEAHDVDADLVVLATTRPQGYSEEFDPSLYRHVSLAPLDPEQALEYGLRLATARHPGQPTRVDELTSTLKKATANPATARLMQSPLQVTIMLALIEGGGEPPEQRWKLFHDYYDVIYRREKERGTPFSLILARHEPDIHWIHHRAGWVLQKRNAAAGQTSARLTHKEFEDIVDSRLESSGHDDAAKRRELVEAIRLAATDRLVLLVGTTEKAIGFEIRTLQEFMAAEHFFDGGELCIQRTLHDIAPYPYWRNVFLFAAGRVFFERQELIDSIIAVCEEMNDAADDAAQRTILSGSRIAVALLKDGAARHRPASVRIIARCAARGFEVCDLADVFAFHELCSGEAEEVCKEELSRSLATSGGTIPERSWLICAQLAGAGRPWAQELLLRHFPWDVPQAYDFVARYGRNFDGAPPAFWDQFARTTVNYPLRSLAVDTWRSEPHKGLLTEFLRQFVAIFDNTAAQEWPLLFGREATGLSVRINGQESLEVWATIQYDGASLRNGHPEWQVCQAISAFAQDPIKANLVKQLASISRIDPDSTACESWQYYPWQVAVCVRARKAGHSWDEIIRRVDAGDIGTESDWTRWEQQKENGIKISQLRSQDALRISDEFQGTMLRDASWIFSYGSPWPLDFVDALANALNQWPELRNQQRVVRLCCFGIYRAVLESGAANHKVIARFITTCSEQGAPITAPILAAILLGPFTPAEKRDLLGKAGTCAFTNWFWHDWPEIASNANEMLSANLGQMLASDDWWNVLRALSFLPPLDALQGVPEALIERLRARGEVFGKAASSLRINSLRWDISDASHVLRESLAISQDHPKYLDQLIAFIESAGKRGPHLEAFLIELIKQDPSDFTPGLLEWGKFLLAKLVARRPAISTLQDPAERLKQSRS